MREVRYIWEVDVVVTVRGAQACIPDHDDGDGEGCERVLDVVVPRERGDLVKLGAAGAGRVWLAWIFQVPDVDLKNRSAHPLQEDQQNV